MSHHAAHAPCTGPRRAPHRAMLTQARARSARLGRIAARIAAQQRHRAAAEAGEPAGVGLVRGLSP